MGRAALAAAALALVAAAVAGGASSARPSYAWVRAAVPAIEAWNADHGTYRGMTLAKLQRSYDRGVRNVRVVRASRTTYCVESTLGRPRAFKNGPGGEILYGSCSNPRAGRPIETAPRPAACESPQVCIRAAVPAIEAYYADHGSYAGMTPAILQSRYDRGVEAITVVRAEQDTYCVESVRGTAAAHKAGPAAPIADGLCAR